MPLCREIVNAHGGCGSSVDKVWLPTNRGRIGMPTHHRQGRTGARARGQNGHALRLLRTFIRVCRTLEKVQSGEALRATRAVRQRLARWAAESPAGDRP